MSEKMNVFRTPSSDGIASREISAVRTGPKVFAIHALACLNVHERFKGEGTEEEGVPAKKSIPYIAGFDSVMLNVRDCCSLYLVSAFGRHAVPVLTTLLTKEFKMSQEEIDTEVSVQAEQLYSKVLQGTSKQ